MEKNIFQYKNIHLPWIQLICRVSEISQRIWKVKIHSRRENWKCLLKEILLCFGPQNPYYRHLENANAHAPVRKEKHRKYISLTYFYCSVTSKTWFISCWIADQNWHLVVFLEVNSFIKCNILSKIQFFVRKLTNGL